MVWVFQSSGSAFPLARARTTSDAPEAQSPTQKMFRAGSGRSAVRGVSLRPSCATSGRSAGTPVKPMASSTRSALIVSLVPGTAANFAGRPSGENSHLTDSTSTPATRPSPTNRSELRFQRRMQPSLWLELVRSM